MAKKSIWLLGCGLGCAGLIALIVCLGIFASSFIKDTRRGFETAEATRRNLEERFGAPDDFVPAADGSIAAQRHRELIRMLSNQLASVADAGDSEQWNQWHSDLAGEIEKMKNDEVRVPWEDSVPRKTAESLEPFRDRLEQSYSRITNPFELSLPTR